ncbi:MAG: peptidoglycan editing factor PgeF [Candidatus Omnitrophica bacterium]|nr:peptidoglycan editing factor PgeF [Candidatus Omnitrophota bacterium]
MQPYNPLEKFKINLVTAAFSKRQDGNMSLCYGDTKNSLKNRQKFLDAINIDYRNLICAQQVHGKNVKYVTEADKGRGALDYGSSFADTDGFFTDKKGVSIAILSADCLSVFIYDPKRPAIAILHAGWRGTEQNICAEGIRVMQDKFGSHPHRMFVGFGPSIRSCCFEVEKDFKSNFPFGLTNQEGRIFMDIALVNQQQLINAGVREENIFDPKICTFSDNDNYFSFRKEADNAGRLVSVIMLK